MALEVRPLSYALGAAVRGIDLRAPADAALQSEIRSLWVEHKVLVFPEQDLTPEQQIAFGRRFGTLDDHKSVPFYRHPDYPEIYLITNKQIDGKASETRDTGRKWHSDHSFTTHPTMATMLYCREIPPVGGTTMFANMVLAYETLSPALQRVLADLEAVHSIAHFMGRSQSFAERDPEQVRKLAQLSPPVAQPVVRVHPESGKKALYISEGLTSHFVGMSVEESRGLLDYLFEHSTRPEFTYRHNWSPNDMLMWDNRSTVHLALPDYSHSDTRHMHRLTVLGEACGRSLSEEPKLAAAA